MFKRLLIIVVLVTCLAVPCFAGEGRLILDIHFKTLDAAIDALNDVEKWKDDVRTVETKAGYKSSAKLVETWDNEFQNKPESTLITVDFEGEKLTYSKINNDVAKLQDDIDYLDLKIAAEEKEVSDKKAIKELKETEKTELEK